MAWLRENLATVIVAAVLVVSVAAALFFTLRARRKGCSCGCGGCPYSADCKKKQPRLPKKDEGKDMFSHFLSQKP